MISVVFLVVLKTAVLVPITLLPIMNPLGNAPIFLRMTQGADEATTRKLARRVVVNCCLLILGAIFVGSYVLAFFGLSLPIVRLAGGLLVAATGWQLLHDDGGSDKGDGAIRSSLSETDSSNWSEAELRQRSFYPISFPLTVGPGTIAASIALGAHQPGRVLDWVISGTAYVSGALVTAMGVYLTYRYARRLLRFMGEMGTTVVMRLSAFILLCIGFEIMWTGLSALIEEVK